MGTEGNPQGFGLENSRDLLENLRWEREELDATPKNDLTLLRYRAFNSAVTAWHMADWVWADMTEAQRKQLETDCAVRLDVNDNKGRRFLKACKDFNRELAICREIANASKHFEVISNPDNTINPRVNADTEGVTVNGEPIVVGNDTVVVSSWELRVLDREDQRDYIEILDQVIEFWTGFLDEREIGK